jgi:uncharacterized membrane protein YjgN (DUF898 family)
MREIGSVVIVLVLLLSVLVATQVAFAQKTPAAGSLLGVTFTQGKDSTSLGVPMQIAILLTLLSLLPAIIIVGDSVLADHRRAALSTAAAGHADDSLHSSADRTGAVFVVLSRCAGGCRRADADLGADGTGRTNRAAGARGSRETYQSVSL